MSTSRHSGFLCWRRTVLQARLFGLGPHRPRAVAALLLSPLAAAAWAAPAPMATQDQVQQKMIGLPIPFEANQGQFAPDVAFAARTFAGTVLVTREGQIVRALAGTAEHRQHAQQSNEVRATGSASVDRSNKAPISRGQGWALVESLQGAHELALAGSQPSATRVSRIAAGAAPNHPQDLSSPTTTR